MNTDYCDDKVSHAHLCCILFSCGMTLKSSSHADLNPCQHERYEDQVVDGIRAMGQLKTKLYIIMCALICILARPKGIQIYNKKAMYLN